MRHRPYFGAETQVAGHEADGRVCDTANLDADEFGLSWKSCGFEKGPYRGQKIEEVIPPEFCVAHDPGDEPQDEDDAGEDDEKNHRRHPRVVTSRKYAAIGIGEFERGYSCQCIRDDIHARVTVDSETDTEKRGRTQLLSSSARLKDALSCLALEDRIGTNTRRVGRGTGRIEDGTDDATRL